LPLAINASAGSTGDTFSKHVVADNKYGKRATDIATAGNETKPKQDFI
jgi:hypothetical protein